jgi:hypothetical protein
MTGGLRVINPQSETFFGASLSPFLSTEFFPAVSVLAHWSVPGPVGFGEGGCPFCRTLTLPFSHKVQDEVLKALLALNASNPAAQRGYYSGFVAPLSLQAVSDTQVKFCDSEIMS